MSLCSDLILKTDEDGEFGKLDPSMCWVCGLAQARRHAGRVFFYFLHAVTFSWRDLMFLEYAPRLRSASISATGLTPKKEAQDIDLLSVHCTTCLCVVHLMCNLVLKGNLLFLRGVCMLLILLIEDFGHGQTAYSKLVPENAYGIGKKQMRVIYLKVF
ncbi:hypothetical protein Tco_0032732 [Tanacetum coccineum]